MKTMVYMVLLMVLCGCGRWGDYIPAVRPTVNNQQIVNLEYNDAFARSLIYFAKRGIPMQIVDKQSGLIVSDTMRWDKLDEKTNAFVRSNILYPLYFDCGKGEPGTRITAEVRPPDIVLHAIFQSVNATQTKVTYEVFAYSMVDHGSMSVISRAPCSKCPYRCYSKGKAEQEFFDEIIK